MDELMDENKKDKYVFVTFAPIQGFIEKSRKLRDLYGASLILSYLSKKLRKAAEAKKAKIISPGLPGKINQGIPNRILIKGDFSEKEASDALIEAWGNILNKCRDWLEAKIPAGEVYRQGKSEKLLWEEEWNKWKKYTWELFWGIGDSADEARQDVEARKLSRRWTAINWIGESSSISGADAIAYPGTTINLVMTGSDYPSSEEKKRRDKEYYDRCGKPEGERGHRKYYDISVQKEEIREYYEELAEYFDGHKDELGINAEGEEIEGKIIDPHERLSIPELVKRLVTIEDVGVIGIPKPKSFKDVVRKTETEQYWTGWFMGDGDRMGEHLKTLAQKSDDKITEFSEIMLKWGGELQDRLQSKLPNDLVRLIYAGGDDFLGIIYSDKPNEQVSGKIALEQMLELHKEWQTLDPKLQPLVGKEVTVSVGFVWVAGGVPQRDVLQHCREAQKKAKSLGRDRITIRIVFNNGQYIDWTTPWEYLGILYAYKDLDGRSNWSHVYRDYGKLRGRHALGFGIKYIDKMSKNEKGNYYEGALEFLKIYFPDYKDIIHGDVKNQKIIEKKEGENLVDIYGRMISWIEDLIMVGWHLLGDIDI